MIVNYKNLSIYYEIHGEGEPLVLLNGIMMQASSWHPLLPLFKGYQVILIDLLDQGKSSDFKDYTISDQGDVVMHILSYLNLTKYHVVGISYGGEVALDVALKSGDTIKTLHLFHSTAYTDMALFQLGEYWMTLTSHLKGLEFMQATMPKIYGKTFQNNHPEFMLSRESKLKEVFQNPNFLQRMYRLTYSAQHTNYLNELSHISCPVLVVSGDEDELILPYYQKRIVEGITHAKHVTLSKIGHASMYEDPQMFVSLIHGFIQTQFVEIIIR